MSWVSNCKVNEADGVRAAGRAGLMYQNISEVSLSVVRRQGACTDSSCRPEVSSQLYSLSTTGMPPNETLLKKEKKKKKIDK